MKKSLLVVLAALLAGSATAAEERVLALEGPYLYTSYDAAISASVQPFVRFKNGFERILTGVTVKVFQRPYMIVDFSTEAGRGSVGYRVNSRTVAVVHRRSDDEEIGVGDSTISSSKRTGTLANGNFTTLLQMSGPNNVQISPSSYPQVDTDADAGQISNQAYVEIFSETSLSDVTFRRPPGNYNSTAYTPDNYLTVVVIFTFDEIPLG